MRFDHGLFGELLHIISV